SLNVSALVPSSRSAASRCDFSDLIDKIKDLKNNDLVGSNRGARGDHKDELLRNAKAAKEAASSGNVDNLAEALGAIIVRVDGGGNDWVTNDGARKINRALQDLHDCLSQAFDQGNNDNDDNDD